MIKNTMLASISVAAVIMFAGCTAEDLVDDISATDYSFCAYYYDGGYSMQTVCTSDENYYLNNYDIANCTGEIYSSFSECDDYAEAAGYNGAAALETTDGDKASAISDAVAATK